jgi:uncharacterized membrane protein
MTARWIAVLPWVIVAGMFVAAALVWPYAPDSVPVHFGVAGQPDRYGSRVEGLLVLPIVALSLLVLLSIVPRVDPLRARYAEFAGTYAFFILALEVFMGLAYAILLASVLGVAVNVSMLLLPLVGLLLIVIGALLDQVQPNWFVGVRTPWTLSSERSWRATHRVGRWVFIVLGVLIGAAGLVQARWMLYTAIGACALGVVGLFVYSYVVWRDDPDKIIR